MAIKAEECTLITIPRKKKEKKKKEKKKKEKKRKKIKENYLTNTLLILCTDYDEKFIL